MKSTKTAAKTAKRRLIDAQGYPAPDFDKVVLSNPGYREAYRYAINYANYQYTNADLKQFTLDWVVQNGVPLQSLDKVDDFCFCAIGKIAWVELNGGEISEESFQYLSATIRDLLKRAAEEKKTEVVELFPTPRRKTAAEVLAANTGKLIAEIEGVLDDKSYVDFLKNFSPSVNTDFGKVKAHFAPQIAELRGVLFDGGDKSGYERYKRPELVSIFNFLNSVMTRIDKQTEVKETVKAKTAPKPKAMKVAKNRVEIAKACQKAQYQRTPDAELGLTSLTPTKIYGAKKVILYNTKYRKVTVLEQATTQGLIIRGTTVDNFDANKSFSHRLRKPKEFFTNGMTFDKVKTDRLEATGRLNEETIIVKVW